MLGSDRHGSASYMREEDPFPSLIGANIILLSIIYIMIIHYPGSSLGRGLLFDSLVFPLGIQHSYAHMGWGRGQAHDC